MVAELLVLVDRLALRQGGELGRGEVVDARTKNLQYWLAMNETKAYSYRRFSSGRQASGHSLERQTEAARLWCAERGYVLDESLAFSDLGVSAYSGANASRGALAGFLSAVNAGQVPRGSVLIVESLDRLSRSAIPEAVALLTSIVKSGVRVVSLIDGQEWNEHTINDTMNFMMSVLLFSRAHEESATKAKRVSAAFQKKRKAGLAVVSAGHGPGWAAPREDRSGWQLLPDRAASVRKAFECAAQGLGGVAIARKANEEAWTLPWRVRANTADRWEHTGVSRLLRDRRVLGEWQPKRMTEGRLVANGEPVQDYFPRAIDEALWISVQAALSVRKGPQRVRGRKADVFSGLLFCQCGERLDRKAPSGRGHARYYCLGRITGVSNCPPIAEALLAEKVLSALAQMEQGSFSQADRTVRLRQELESQRIRLAEATANANRILSLIEGGEANRLLLERLSARESEIDSARAEMRRISEDLQAIPPNGAAFGAEFAATALNSITNPSDIAGRHSLMASLNAIVKRITWNGRYLHAELKSGTTVGIMVPPTALVRAKNRNAGVPLKRKAADPTT